MHRNELNRRTLLRAAAVALPTAALVGMSPAPAAAATWSGYVEVPGGMFTRSSPFAVTYNGFEYLFVRGTGDFVFVNRFDGVSWSGYTQLPGRQTRVAPTAAVHNGFLYLFLTDNPGGGRLYFNRFDGASWSGYIELPGNGRTFASQAAASDGRFLYAFHVGTSSSFANTFYFTRFDGASFSPYAEVPPGRAQTRAGLTANFFNGAVNVFHSGLNGTATRVYQNQVSNGVWTPFLEVPSGGTVSTLDTNTGATTFGAGQVLALRAASNRIFTATNDGVSWGPFSEVPGGALTAVGPAVNAYAGGLDVFISADVTRIFRNTFR